MEHVDVAVIGGGQSGLAAAHALVRAGLKPLVLEASQRAAGSWPRHYDSLTLFSPARFSALPGMAFGGGLDRHPHRDEVAAYLDRYAARLDVEIRTGSRVARVAAEAGGRPHPPYLADLDGALDAARRPRHRHGASLTHPGLAFVGLEWQRSLSSNTLRGVGRDAARAARSLAGHLR